MNTNLNHKILGHHFIVGLESTELTDKEKELLSKIEPFGIILFARNFTNNPDWIEKCKALIQSAKDYSNNSIKLVSIDFEGGRVNRFPDGIKRYPYAQEWSGSVTEISLEMADILNNLGINLTYGPVCDVDLNESNPVIGKRSFSKDYKSVSKSALEFIDAYRSKGIICCAKHFSGHGRTAIDSHFNLPILDCSEEELAIDLAPFKAVVEHNVPLVMTAHVIFNCYDPILPASLSHTIQTNLLRGKLGFKGLIITDDMDMKALSTYTPKEKCEIALLAGTDLLLFGNGMDGKALESVDQIINDLLKSKETTELENALRNSSDRLANLKIN